MIHGRKIAMRVAQKMNNDLIVSEQKAKAIMGASMDALVELNHYPLKVGRLSMDWKSPITQV